MSTGLPLITPAGGALGAATWPGGSGLVSVVGTFGGTSVQLQWLGPDGSTWVNVGSAISQAGNATFSLPNGKVQATITGGSGVSLTGTAYSVPTLLG